MYRHLLINADQCVVDLVNPLASDYKHVKNAGGGSSSDDNIDLVIIIVCVSIGGVTLLIFACWLCAKKCPIFLVRPEFE